MLTFTIFFAVDSNKRFNSGPRYNLCRLKGRYMTFNNTPGLKETRDRSLVNGIQIQVNPHALVQSHAIYLHKRPSHDLNAFLFLYTSCW